jgi:hypothetical protein
VRGVEEREREAVWGGGGADGWAPPEGGCGGGSNRPRAARGRDAGGGGGLGRMVGWGRPRRGGLVGPCASPRRRGGKPRLGRAREGGEGRKGKRFFPFS